MLTIDGSYGEGGGQIIRSSLALSLITAKPFRIYNVRAGRAKPGLQRQHLTAVNAAAEISHARVDGVKVGASEFTFIPGEVSPGEYAFDIGTAGSTTLVLQTVLPPLMLATAPSVLALTGGTHNPFAPPFDFLAQAFLLLINRMGPHIAVELARYGFYPPGGGKLNVYIEPAAKLHRLDLVERGEITAQRARALVVNLPPSVGELELIVIKEQLNWSDDQLRVEASNNAHSPGNVLTIEIESEHLTEIITGMGERGVRAETVAARAVTEAQRYLSSPAPVGEHLADQLLIPLALAGGGSYTTGPLSLHTTTNIEIVKKFLPVEITVEQMANDVFSVKIQA